MAAVDAIVKQVAALQRDTQTDGLTEQVQRLVTAQEQTIAALDELRDRVEKISADVAANARAAAANIQGKAKEIEHRVVFVPADTQEPQLKQHQRVRAT